MHCEFENSWLLSVLHITNFQGDDSKSVKTLAINFIGYTVHLDSYVSHLNANMKYYRNTFTYNLPSKGSTAVCMGSSSTALVSSDITTGYM